MFDFQDCVFNCPTLSAAHPIALLLAHSYSHIQCFGLSVSCRDVIRKPLAESDGKVLLSPV